MNWTQKICPLLSERPSQSALVGAPSVPAKATACLGPQCAFFLTHVNERKEIVGGSCAITALPTVVSSLLNLAVEQPTEKGN